MSRLVVDTNVLISAFFWPGIPTRLLHLASAQQITLVTSEVLMAELQDVLMRRKFEKRLLAIGRTAEAFLSNYRALAEVIDVEPLPAQVSDDPDDDAVLACAVAGKWISLSLETMTYCV